ncbi:MAG: Spx/MgsR family RNA polymerase-binding regulatory protein [Leptolyngbya sp.]|nr:Spx/MgsR family RNA polymerase-binding regulatory protein [Leptolyngbya sp.]
MALTVYGIPTCTTCKKALQWLDQQAIAYEFVDTKQSPPSRALIADWVAELGSKPLRNTSGQVYRSLGEEKQTWTAEQWIDAFAANAMLLKRPLFVQHGKAIAVGFRPESPALQALLSLPAKG